MAVRQAKCPAEITLRVIGGQWKTVILYHLFQGTRRFTQLLRNVTGITQKMLTRQLREMERDGIVRRRVYAEVPPKVEYSLTSLGKSLRPVLETMCKWGDAYGDRGARHAACGHGMRDVGVRLHPGRPSTPESS